MGLLVKCPSKLHTIIEPLAIRVSVLSQKSYEESTLTDTYQPLGSWEYQHLANSLVNLLRNRKDEVDRRGAIYVDFTVVEA